MPDLRQQPVPRRAAERWRCTADRCGEPACLYPVFRETLPDGRTYRVIDQVDNPRADDFPGDNGSGRHICS